MSSEYDTLSEDTKAQILSLALEGWPVSRIAARFRVSRYRVSVVIDPEGERLRQKRKSRRGAIDNAAAATSRKAAGLTMLGIGSARAEIDWARLQKLIPKDTRTLTGRLLGDPLFERSALFKRQLWERPECGK